MQIALENIDGGGDAAHKNRRINLKNESESEERRKYGEETEESGGTLKSQFGSVLDQPNVTPEMLSILLYEMTRQIGEAFA